MKRILTNWRLMVTVNLLLASLTGNAQWLRTAPNVYLQTVQIGLE
ncbi:MAG: hypothetical protein ABI416_11610 [Ginsengibacter sp.]